MDTSLAPSYASAAAAGRAAPRAGKSIQMTQKDKQDERFWECRRSLRLWPVPNGSKASLKEYLTSKLEFEDGFLDDVGEVTIKKVVKKKPKYKDEVVVTFEEKAVRDAVKAQAHKLADHRETAGMRLQIPDHLQKTFRSLMNLSYELKKRNPDLRRSIKFDEDTMSMFMDIQTTTGGNWRRVEPEQAAKFNADKRVGASPIGSEELDELLEGSRT